MALDLVGIAKKFLIRPAAAVGRFVSEGANNTVYGPNWRERSQQLELEKATRRRLLEANIARTEAGVADDAVARKLQNLSLQDKLDEQAALAEDARQAGMSPVAFRAKLRQMEREQKQLMTESLIQQRAETTDIKGELADMRSRLTDAQIKNLERVGAAGPGAGLSGRFIQIMGSDGQPAAWFPKTGGVASLPEGVTFKPTDKEAELRSVASTTIKRLIRLKQLFAETGYAGTGPYEGPIVAAALSKLPEDMSRQALKAKYGANYDKMIEIQSLARALNDDLARAKEGAVIPEEMMKRIERFSVSPDIQSDLLGRNLDRLLSTMQEIQGMRSHGGLGGGPADGAFAPAAPGAPGAGPAPIPPASGVVRKRYNPATGALEVVQ